MRLQLCQQAGVPNGQYLRRVASGRCPIDNLSAGAASNPYRGRSHQSNGCTGLRNALKSFRKTACSKSWKGGLSYKTTGRPFRLARSGRSTWLFVSRPLSSRWPPSERSPDMTGREKISDAIVQGHSHHRGHEAPVLSAGAARDQSVTRPALPSPISLRQIITSRVSSEKATACSVSTLVRASAPQRSARGSCAVR